MGIEMRRMILPIGATFLGGLAIVGCKGEKPAEPTPENNPVTSIVLQCNPTTYAEGLHALGIPTPVGIGGKETDQESNKDALDRIMAIRKKIDNCEKLTDEDVLALIEWNLTHPQKGEVPTLQPTPPPDNITPNPKPSETAVTVEQIDALQNLLPKELKDTAKVIRYKNRLGVWTEILAWEKVQPKLPITASSGNAFMRILENPHKAIIQIVEGSNNFSVDIFGALSYPNNNISYKIAEGQKQTVAWTGTDYNYQLGDQSFPLIMGTRIISGSLSASDILKQISPDAYEKPFITIEEEYAPSKTENQSAISPLTPPS